MRRVAALVLVIAAAPALAGVTLRYAYQPGLYTVSSRQSMAMTISADDPERQASLARVNPFEQDTTFVMEQRFEAIEGADDYRVESVLSEIDNRVTLAGQPAPMGMTPMGDLKGLGFTGTIDREGRVRDVEVTNVPTGAGLDQAVARQMADLMAKSYPLLPARPLSKGDSFDHWVEASLPFPGLGEGGEPLKLGITTTYTVRDWDDDVAHLDVLQTFSLVGAGEQLAMTLEGEGTGEALFDLEEGFFRETRIDMDLVMILTLPQRMKVQITSETAVTQERGGPGAGAGGGAARRPG